MRSTIIRLALGFVFGATSASILLHACAWIITAASLGAFLTFVVWLIGLILFIISSAYTGVVVDKVLDGAAVVRNASSSLFARARAAFAK